MIHFFVIFLYISLRRFCAVGVNVGEGGGVGLVTLRLELPFIYILAQRLRSLAP